MTLANSEFTKNLDKTIQIRADYLQKYQNKKYVQRYLQMVERVRTLENGRMPGNTGLTSAVALNYFKLLAYKDEYEVSRLYTNGNFLKKINNRFDGDFKLKFHLAPPLFSRRDKITGEPKKTDYGMWVLTAMNLLSKFKFLRGTLFDPFGRTPERKMERRLIIDYEKTLEKLLRNFSKTNHNLAVEIAKIPEQIRGYDLVKHSSLKSAKICEKELMDRFLKLTDEDIKIKNTEILS